MIIPVFNAGQGDGYIAGTGTGIATINGVPSRVKISIFTNRAKLIRTEYSLPNGHYMISGLNPNEEYLIVARGIKTNADVDVEKPHAWDYIKPATDLTPVQQRALYNSWQ